MSFAWETRLDDAEWDFDRVVFRREGLMEVR